MGRFYETEKSRFVDDFIYKPNFELMNAVVGKEQKNFDDTGDAIKLLNKIDIRYIEDPVERAKVKEIQDTYGKQTDALSNRLRDTTKNWREVLPEIESLRKNLKADYDTGNIYKIQKSRDNYDKFQKDKEKITDINTRNAADKYYMGNWQKNANRSIDGIFDYEDTYDKKDPVGDFAKEMKAINDPKSWEKASANPSGNGYLLKTWDGYEARTEKEVHDAFERYLDAKGLRPYFEQRNKILGEKYKDADGNLDFKSKDSVLNSMDLYGQKLLKVDNTKQTKDINFDQKYDNDTERALKAAAGAKKEKDEAEALSIGLDQKEFFTKTASGKALIADLNRETDKIVPGLKNIKNEDERNRAIETYRANATPEQRKALAIVELIHNKNMESGEKGLVQLYNANVAKSVKDEVNSDRVRNLFGTEPVVVEFGKQDGVQSFSKKSIDKLYGDKGENAGIKLEKFIGQNMNDGVYQIVDGVKVPEKPFVPESYKVIPGSVSSMFVKDGDRGPALGATSIIVFQDKDGNEKRVKATIPKKVVNFDVNQGEIVKGYK